MYFQNIILELQKYWSEYGCVILQPYDMEVGAGTSHPATALQCLANNPWNVAYVQPCRRPADARYGENPNRMQHYYQFQVILKPSPDDIQELCLKSLYQIGIDPKAYDIRFIEDDWENPTLGAWGLGWELWCNGMEIFQFTYMQQIGTIECKPIPGELTYGLERLAMFVQGVKSVWDIVWNKEGLKYRDVFLKSEKEYSWYNFKHADTVLLTTQFGEHENECAKLLQHGLAYPAYDQCLKANHIFNLLNSRGVISVTERASYISRIRNLVKDCCSALISNKHHMH
ncbi:glycine--tRNA ligase subunit alpha [Rickettsiales endosymbiont of Peranema trichophorum]|uniref:glycine--tRNA ligase subunit alpha n=1 Tax=Rickettsiales endosymbiont of Peranema trichophorum TaxID=2486577 RepID=UPI001022B279|nr:glycine--tRNA ligase subunit alpha [Rickettsiales endosymbiont of Peranema trichophorum]RZI47625.1 glycine--tRNA ligase subunit alpha [Rickettsiales endosymbiont of Peranema trichophorum]